MFQLPGKPDPEVNWWVNETVLLPSARRKTDTHITENRMMIPHVKREDLNSTYKCKASNTKLVPPLENTIRLELNCK